MHIPNHHAESRVPILRQVIRDYPLGVLTTAIPTEMYPLIQVSHIPFILDVEDESSETEFGTLRGHMARQNPQSKAVMETLTLPGSEASSRVLEQEVLVLFTATPQHYVTPKFYIETKPVTGKVVPTWNYVAVQAYGQATFYYDSKSEETSEFLNSQMDALSKHTETHIMDYTGAGDRPGPWKVTDAPERYVELMKKNIIGVEIAITRLEGKFKMSQEMRKGDREGVIQGFGRMESDVGRDMHRLIKERDMIKEAGK